MIKAKVREVSQHYSKFIQRKRKAKENFNLNQLTTLEKTVFGEP